MPHVFRKRKKEREKERKKERKKKERMGSAFPSRCEETSRVCERMIYKLQHLAIITKAKAWQCPSAKTNRNTQSQVVLTSENQLTNVRHVLRGHKRSPKRPAGI